MREITLKNGLRFWTRPGTSDHNSAIACAQEDEYGLQGYGLKGKLVFDIGAHIGGVAILATYLGAYAVAVEPVPENVEIIRANAMLNGFGVQVLAGAVGTDMISYGWTGEGLWGEETGAVHSFIGNTGLGLEREGYVPSRTLAVKRYTLEDIARLVGVTPYLVKLDCEGGEWSALAEPIAKEIPVLVGEYHGWDGASVGAEEFFGATERILDLIGDTHEVNFPDDQVGNAAGHFVALSVSARSASSRRAARLPGRCTGDRPPGHR